MHAYILCTKRLSSASLIRYLCAAQISLIPPLVLVLNI